MKRIIILIMCMVLLNTTNGCNAKTIEPEATLIVAESTEEIPETITEEIIISESAETVENATKLEETVPVVTEYKPTLEELIYAEFIDFNMPEPQTIEAAYDNASTVEDYIRHLNYLLDMAEGTTNYERAAELILPELEEAISLQNYYNSLAYQMKKSEEHEAKWEKRYEEYYTASRIWVYLKNAGFNDYVCAGILGNIMAETGGNTLYVKAEIYDGTGFYYGICQWNASAYGRIFGTDLETQLDFLMETIEHELNAYGGNYRSGFKYADFISLENAEDAALAFAKSYERCSGYSYSSRQHNALKAYEYFTN